ncbi:hypothetical protein STRAU_1228 [Streptomyces aurantiacus JA 4570]|uniref:Uncharacterized protein n=1 Tax=Streptomyces aurantiacus JA 4570 TaxID=1286094 RepID=S3ZRA3_9ACTN|nr:hypothetical protein STRAU_1228 [Streptomyces aurantiacus JA 4570]
MKARLASTLPWLIRRRGQRKDRTGQVVARGGRGVPRRV